MRKINATIQGLITGTLMILISLLIFQVKQSFDNNLQYITYAVYIAGITWTLVYFHRFSSQEKKFKNYFSQGFKCFIVVTLLMVAFTWVFMYANPGLEDEMAANYRKDLLANGKDQAAIDAKANGNYTPSEIDGNVAKAREYFVPMLISGVIFGYLMIGALVTAVTSFLLSNKKNRQA